MTENQKRSLGEVVTDYVAGLTEEDKRTCQPDVFKFVRWIGWDRPLAELTPAEVANYAERISLSDSDYVNKLVMVRAFLNWVKREQLSSVNLAVHLRPKKSKVKAASRKNLQPAKVQVTEEGYIKLKEELAELQQKRPEIIAEITRAAADKDFRENAPLEAAREQHGLIEGRIREIEAIIKAAEIVDKPQATSLKVCIGDNIVLIEVASGEEMQYKIVGPREADPSRGKISGVSPVGKACVGRHEGETVEVNVPAGMLQYQIKQIKR